MTFYKIIETLKKIVGEDNIDEIRESINEAHTQICYDIFGNDLLATATISVVAGTVDYELPTDFGMLVDIYAAETVSNIVTTETYIHDQINNTAGDISNFMIYSFSASSATVCNLPTATIVSTDGADTMDFQIIGEDLKGIYTEWHGVLAGLVGVVWSTSAGVGRVEKVYIQGNTTGTCTIASATATTAFISLSGGVTEYDGTRGRNLVRTTPGLDKAGTYIVLYKRQPSILIKDLDRTDLPSYCDDLIIASSIVRYLKYNKKDMEMLQFWQAQAMQSTMKIDSIVNRQRNRHVVMTPVYDY